MAKIIRMKQWAKRQDPKKGHRLQILANRMLMAGDIGPNYQKVRRAAEHHLGFWDWQTRRIRVAQTAEACKAVRCHFLPAGSEACRNPDHVCP